MRTQRGYSQHHFPYSSSNKMKDGAGYTLIELLISISIFAILSSITVFGFRGVGRANMLKQASAELVANLRMIQSLATTGGSVKTCGGEMPVTACTTGGDCGASWSCDTVSPPPGGYGILLAADGTGYTMFASMTKLALHARPSFNPTHDPVVVQGNVLMADDLTISAYEGTRIPYSAAITFVSPRGLPNVDAYYCISRPEFPNLRYKVTVFKDSGQILEETVAECPLPI